MTTIQRSDETRMLALTVACLAGTVADIARTTSCIPGNPDTIAALGRAERACLALEEQVRAMDLMSLDDASGKELA
ncbi:hypothetical protein [Pseudoscardovia suis]|uniref:Uncharacterized protein n=1 Tax=Pseudoscardovia suis TaxID=987063 RepID=A0A261F0Z4_9BIFI|nr:hypothetical protein [Pseudoscardovia suis]OZG52790.1 hypothetical protein PSSU_0408 [Pseudoscardovia suis]PJJ64965.1 hypothetical protein CLV65_1517 [Pseudoscardovia suis]